MANVVAEANVVITVTKTQNFNLALSVFLTFS
jgi:hypothetical protein